MAKSKEKMDASVQKKVKRNIGHFPDDFMFQLKPPYAVTEQGIYMLATVLKPLAGVATRFFEAR
ncbi:MAG: ORF6N domain-containing protein [Lachnospiraceae bacterium]|nr:ORF6N domain-containing protein [Lachnospiraceae bacterium]